jgi:hypothetical protein
MSSIQEYGNDVKERVASWHLLRKAAWILGILLLCGIIYSAFIVYYPYSEGTRTGYLSKLSYKGFGFKTWEGQLQIPTLTAATGNNQLEAGGNMWLFSVKRGDDAVIKDLQDAEANHIRVTLHYTQYMKQFQWRGETAYFVTKVTK